MASLSQILNKLERVLKTRNQDKISELLETWRRESARVNKNEQNIIHYLSELFQLMKSTRSDIETGQENDARYNIKCMKEILVELKRLDIKLFQEE